MLDELYNKVANYLDNDLKEKKNQIQLIMVELQNHYNDPKVTSLYYAQKEIEKVKIEQKENLKKLLENTNLIGVVY